MIAIHKKKTSINQVYVSLARSNMFEVGSVQPPSSNLFDVVFFHVFFPVEVDRNPVKHNVEGTLKESPRAKKNLEIGDALEVFELGNYHFVLPCWF